MYTLPTIHNLSYLYVPVVSAQPPWSVGSRYTPNYPQSRIQSTENRNSADCRQMEIKEALIPLKKVAAEERCYIESNVIFLIFGAHPVVYRHSQFTTNCEMYQEGCLRIFPTYPIILQLDIPSFQLPIDVVQ